MLAFARSKGVQAPAVRTVVAGSSYGGLAAACAALRHPDRLGNVLSLSGSFWWKPAGGSEQPEKPEWVARHYAQGPKRPLRFHLEAGLLETGEGQQGILETNRHLRDVLRARGYDVTHVELAGGHDPLVWRGALANGLISLFGKDAVSGSGVAP